MADAINEEIVIVEEEQSPEIQETVDIIDVSDVAPEVIDSLSAFPALGEPNELIRHNTLNGRSLPDQHPITSIIGLRDELDNIEALQTIYSDKKNHANYYLWQDENIKQEKRVGYFVTVCSDTDTIKICDETDDIFGVTVKDAAFVGGQDDVERDYKYGLVVHSGVVAVQCELDVLAGDNVVSNAYGYAQKATSGYGYKVTEVQNINGVMHAIIPLGVPMNQINSLMAEFDEFDERMDKAETNIIAAMNTATEAYNKANEASGSCAEAVSQATAAADRANSAADSIGGFQSTIESISQTASQARAIAETIYGETVEKANEALTDIYEDLQEIRDEINNIDIDIDIENEEIIKEMQDSIDKVTEDTADALQQAENALQQAENALKQAEDLAEDMTPLVSWVGPDSSGVAGFVAKANEEYAQLGTVVQWKDDMMNPDSGVIASINQKVSAAESNINSLASWKDGATTSIANIQQKANTNESNISSLTTWKGQTNSAITSIQQTANQQGAKIQEIASWQDETDEAIVQINKAVDANESSISSLTSWKGETNSAIANIQQKANTNESNISSLTTWKGQTNSAITSIQQTANQQGAKIQEIASWQDETDEAIVQINKAVDANESAIEEVASWKNANASAIATTITKANANESKIQNITKWQGEKDTAIASVESRVSTTESNIKNLTSWQSDAKTSIASIQQKTNDTGAYITSVVANVNKYSVGKYSQAYGLSLEQAKTILETGMIYVPTDTSSHSETYGTSKQTFTRTYYYTWNGSKWTESTKPSVYFTTATPSATSQYIYWFTDGTPADSAYVTNTLYKWENSRWNAVATLSENLDSRKTNAITQDLNGISTTVTNTAGSVATLQTNVSDTSSKVSQIVGAVGSNGKVTAASIITAVNNDTSEVAINAEKIKLEGYTSINGGFVVDEDSNLTMVNIREFYASDYTSNDLTYIKTLYNSTNITESDFDKYDVNLDGIISSEDYTVINQLVKGTYDKIEVRTKTTLTPVTPSNSMSVSRVIKIYKNGEILGETEYMPFEVSHRGIKVGGREGEYAFELKAEGSNMSPRIYLDGKSLADLIYPVGSIYISTVDEVPKIVPGAMWVFIDSQFLLGANYSTIGTTGGEETHTLTETEMPQHSHSMGSHTHSFSATASGGGHNHTARFKGFGSVESNTNGYYMARRVISGDAYDTTATITHSADGTHTHSISGTTGGASSTTIGLAGWSGAHNNMPPYVAVWIYERVG